MTQLTSEQLRSMDASDLYYAGVHAVHVTEWAKIVAELSHRAEQNDLSATAALIQLYNTKGPRILDAADSFIDRAIAMVDGAIRKSKENL